MTDEQIAIATPNESLAFVVEEYIYSKLPNGSQQITRDIIEALQSNGQYIVFAAPTGYRFAAPKVMTEETLFPAFYAHSHEVIPIPAKVTCVGMKSTWLEPLTGGVE